MSRKILVTGGAGFIGSNFIRYMLDKYPHYEIINYDLLTYAGNPENVRDLEKLSNYEFIHGDILDTPKLDILRNVDAIINFAAESHVDRSIGRAGDFISTNVMGTLSLLEVCKTRRISRFIQVSTDEVYGSKKKGSFKERDRLDPSSPYSASKASSDLLALSYYKTHNVPVIVTRSSNNFGPYQYPEKLIPLFTTNAIKDERLPIYGDGENVRDWIYVEDNCSAIDAVLHKGLVGHVYNIGGGNEVTNNDISKIILDKLSKPETLVSFVKDRLGHDFRYSINCDKVKKLGWEPSYKFEDAMEKTIDWYKDNPQWWKPLLESRS